MTQQEVIKWWPEIEAFKNGKTIEARKQHGVWRVNTNPNFCLTCEYRVKEDPPEPEYVPFDFSDAEAILGKKIIKKDTNVFVAIIVSVHEHSVKLGNDFSYYFDTLHKTFTFLDGSPCGKLKK